MKKVGIILFLSFFITSFNALADLNGSWEGKLMISPEMSLRLVINISGAETDSPAVTMDSPDQGAYGIPMQINCLEGDSLNVAVPQLMLTYAGSLKGSDIVGQLSQGGYSFPLSLSPKTETLNRPQTPTGPFPYTEEEISFASALDGALLHGTLTMPEKFDSETPVTVLISGSGTQNRDEELFGHRPFAVIADYLAKNGIASLRYDDRGFDISLGLQPNATSRENAMDALGALNFLKKKDLRI